MSQKAQLCKPLLKKKQDGSLTPLSIPFYASSCPRWISTSLHSLSSTTIVSFSAVKHFKQPTPPMNPLHTHPVFSHPITITVTGLRPTCSLAVFASQPSLPLSSVKQTHQMEMAMKADYAVLKELEKVSSNCVIIKDKKKVFKWIPALLSGQTLWVISAPMAYASDVLKANELYETGELFDLGIQLLYLILLLGLLGAGTYYVIRQVLVRRELDLSAKELQEQVRSGDASATELFELGAVMLRRKFYPAATKYLLEAIEKWDGDNQDLAQVYNALGVSYIRDGKVDKGITQFETAVKLQLGYVTAWNNLGDAYEKKKDYKSALKAFEEALLFDPNNKMARPRRDAMRDSVKMYKGVPVKTKEK